jgi:hypothetical protein
MDHTSLSNITQEEFEKYISTLIPIFYYVNLFTIHLSQAC